MALAVLITPLAVSAYAVKKGDSVYAPKGETIEGNLYAVAANITIDGDVMGDIICAGQSINISGKVAGDIICAGQSINISGKIGGSLRLIGETINYSGQTARNGAVLGATIITSDDSTIGWDLLALGNIFEFRGDIGGYLNGYLGKANIAGKVGKNIKLNFGSKNANQQPLLIASSAEINGDVSYTADQAAVIENNAVISGKIIHNLPIVAAKRAGFFSFSWWWVGIISIFSALVVGLVLISFWREAIIKTTDLMANRVGASLGRGILVLVLTLPLTFVLLVTIIGIPLSLILMALWLVSLYVSKVIIGIMVGRKLANKFFPLKKDSLIFSMILGIVICFLIFSLPIIGKILALLAMVWGLGGITLALKNK